MRTARLPETTLDIARAIADAVLAADLKGARRSRNSVKDAPTQAVLAVLERTGTWFSRVTEDAAGAITSARPRARGPYQHKARAR